MYPLRVLSTMGRMPRRPLPNLAVVTQVGIGRTAFGANLIPITRLVDSTRYCPNSRCAIRYRRDTFWDSSTTTTTPMQLWPDLAVLLLLNHQHQCYGQQLAPCSPQRRGRLGRHLEIATVNSLLPVALRGGGGLGTLKPRNRICPWDFLYNLYNEMLDMLD